MPGTTLGAGDIMGMKEDKISDLREFKVGGHPNAASLLRMLWVTFLEDLMWSFSLCWETPVRLASSSSIQHYG